MVKYADPKKVIRRFVKTLEKLGQGHKNAKAFATPKAMGSVQDLRARLPVLETKRAAVAVSALSQAGGFEGYASLFNVVDLGRDMVVPGAFGESLKARGAAGVKLLWQHDAAQVIGSWLSIAEDGKGLFVRGQLNLDVAKAREVYALMKEGAVDGLSIGFRTQKSVTDSATGVRRLQKLDLWEISIVTFPMLPNARVSSVKQLPDMGARLAAAIERGTTQIAAQNARRVMDVRLTRAIERGAQLMVRKLFNPDQPRDALGRWTSGGGAGGSLGSLGQNLLGDLASSVLPGVISGLAGGLGDLGSGLGNIGGGLDPTALDSGLDTTALGNGLSNGIDFTPTGSVIGTAPDGTPIDNAVLAQGDGAGVDLAGATKPDLTPKLLTTADGKPVLNYKGEPIYYPAAYPPEFFKNAGEQAANWRQMTMASDSPMQIPFEDLYKFRQGGEWDMQRLTGPVDANYIDYATVAIGIYGRDVFLTLSSTYSLADNAVLAQGDLPDMGARLAAAIERGTTQIAAQNARRLMARKLFNAGLSVLQPDSFSLDNGVLNEGDDANIDLAASTTSPRYAARMLGYDYNTFSDMIHKLKPDQGDRRIFPNGKIGDVNTRVGVWSFSAKLLVNSDQLDPYVTFLIAKFGLPRSDLPDLLARMNTTMRCLCFWSNYSGDRIAKVSPHLQDILAKSGIVLEIDEYPGTNNGQPWPDIDNPPRCSWPLGDLGQSLLGDLATSVLPGILSGLAGTLGDIGGAMDPSALANGLDATALGGDLGGGLSNGLDLTPTGSVVGVTPDGTLVDNAVLAQGDNHPLCGAFFVPFEHDFPYRCRPVREFNFGGLCSAYVLFFTSLQGHNMQNLELKTADPALAFESFSRTFANYMETNDDRIHQLETRKSIDPLTEDKLARLDSSLNEAKSRLDKIALEKARPRLGETKEVGQADPATRERKAAFRAYMAHGDASQLRALEAKNMSEGSGPDGGYLVAPEVEKDILFRMSNASSMRALASVQSISTSQLNKAYSISGPSSGWAAEADLRPAANTPQLAQLIFPAYELYATPAATQRLLDDSIVDVEQWIAEEVNTVFAEQESAAFISGNGVNKPTGVLASATVQNASWAWGKLGYIDTGAAGAFASTNGTDVMFDFIYALKAGYRQNATFVMNRKTLAQVRKLKDADGNYIWQPPVTLGAMSTLMNFPVSEDENMPDIAADATPIMFGDFKRGYLIVDRLGIRVLRDPFSSKPYVLFYTTKRVGGGIQDYDAIKLLKFGTA
eukprot:gene9569-9645_t